jgi:hypothetical protein
MSEKSPQMKKPAAATSSSPGIAHEFPPPAAPESIAEIRRQKIELEPHIPVRRQCGYRIDRCDRPFLRYSDRHDPSRASQLHQQRALQFENTSNLALGFFAAPPEIAMASIAEERWSANWIPFGGCPRWRSQPALHWNVARKNDFPEAKAMKQQQIEGANNK